MASTPTAAATATSAAKVRNVLRISDACQNVAEFLDAVRRDILPPGNLTKTKRNAICRDLVVVIESLTNAHDLGYASTGKLSATKQNKKAHKKAKRAEKIIMREEERTKRKKKNTMAKPPALQLLKRFNDAAATALSDLSSGNDLAVIDVSPEDAAADDATDIVGNRTLGDTVRQTRSGSFGILMKLPPLTPGYESYSPKEVIDFLMGEVDKQDEMRAKKQLGLQDRISELKNIKLYMSEKNLVPCSVGNINKVVRIFKKTGAYPPAWNIRGPRPAMELDEITSAMVKRCEQHRCSTFGIKDIKAVLLEHARQSNPHASESQLSVSPQCIDSFKTAIATRSGLIFVKNAMDRNVARERSVLSLRNSCSMVHVVSVAELIVGPEGVPIPDDAPEGCVWLRNAVSKAHGGVVVTAIPAAVKVNTDDSKTFFFMNTNASKEDEDEVRIGLSKDKATAGVYSFHRRSQAGSNRFNGILFRSTVSISGGGYVAPIVLCVDGFTENEIPKDLNPEGFVVLEVPGLCIGGDTDARNGNVGYVVLLRDEKGVMARYFEWYDIHIREPFIDMLRVNVCGMDDAVVSSPPKKYQASLSHDGGTEQATANVKETRLAAHAAKRNHCLKVAANASLIQQEADVATKGFRSMKSKTKLLSLSNVTTNTVEVKLKAVLRIAKMKTGAGAKGLNLAFNTEKNLIEGVKRMPTVYAASYSSDNVKAAFVTTGRIDDKYFTFPNGKTMLETLKRSIDPEEYKMVDTSFTEMNLEVFDRGMVSEASFNKYGFKLDATSDGNEEVRNFGISQERRQRWKLYGHPVEIESRRKHAARTREKANIARRRDDVEITQALALNREAEGMLHQSSGRDSTQVGGNARRLLSGASIEFFGEARFLKKHHQAFSQVRITDGTRRKSSYSFDRKRGNLVEVKAAMEAKAAGELYDEAQLETWIYVSWSLRHKPVIMQAPPDPSEAESTAQVDCMPEMVQFAAAPAPPSAPTNMTVWVSDANNCFDGVDFDTPNEEMVHLRRMFMPLVASRFVQRKNESLPQDRQAHWTMKFVADNLERVSSLALLAGHIVPNLAEVDAEFSCLLLPPDKAELEDARSNEYRKRQGIYEYWDTTKKRGIRIGRVGGDKQKRNFGKRDSEHVAGSKHTHPDDINSLFYLMYSDEFADVALAIIPKVTSSFSIAGSVYILQHVLRSQKRRARCYHRLLCGMSAMDVISSFKSFLSTWILPRETGTWGAVGTVATCTGAGFFGQGSSIASPLYNGSLALFYLLTVRYGWQDDASGAYGGGRFASIEPIMHGVPLAFGWSTAIAGIPLTLYNPIGWTCWIGEVPRGCDRDPSVPCERGDNAYIYRWAFFHAELWFTFVAVAGMMYLMYRSVRQKELKTNRFSLRQQSSTASSSKGKGSAQTSQSRRVATQALFYVLAYYLTWIFPAVTWLTQLTQGKTYTAILLLQAFFVPLQGFFNAAVYLRPRYLRYRSLKPDAPRWRAMVSTFGADLRPVNGESDSFGQQTGGSAPRSADRRDTDFHTLNETRRKGSSLVKGSPVLNRLSASSSNKRSSTSGQSYGEQVERMGTDAEDEERPAAASADAESKEEIRDNEDSHFNDEELSK